MFSNNFEKLNSQIINTCSGSSVHTANPNTHNLQFANSDFFDKNSKTNSTDRTFKTNFKNSEKSSCNKINVDNKFHTLNPPKKPLDPKTVNESASNKNTNNIWKILANEADFQKLLKLIEINPNYVNAILFPTIENEIPILTKDSKGSILIQKMLPSLSNDNLVLFIKSVRSYL